MLNELNALESKVAEVVALCQALRAENDELRQRLVAAEGASQRLAQRMAAARVRIEKLAKQLPETTPLEL